MTDQAVPLNRHGRPWRNVVPLERFADDDIGTGDYHSWAEARWSMALPDEEPRVLKLIELITTRGLFRSVEVLSDEDGRDPIVIDGHHRVEALRRLGMAVPIQWRVQEPAGDPLAFRRGVPPEPATTRR